MASWAELCRLWAEEKVPQVPVAPDSFLLLQLPLGSNPWDGGMEVASADKGKEAVMRVGGDSTDVTTQPGDWMVKNGHPVKSLLLLLIFPERKKSCSFHPPFHSPNSHAELLSSSAPYLLTLLQLQHLVGAHEKWAQTNQEFMAVK